MTTVFVSASFRWKRLARQWATLLEQCGLAVSSTWHAPPDDTEVDPDDEATRCRLLAVNLADLQRADCLLVLSSVGEPRATFAEAGFALACGKPTVFVHHGPVGRQLFDSHPKAVRVDMDDLLGPIGPRIHAAIREAVSR